VGGKMLELGVGSWRICAWLVDDAASGATVASSSTVVTVAPYTGSVYVSLRRIGSLLQLELGYRSSAPARLYVWLQRARRTCARTPSHIPHSARLVLPRHGRTIGSDGALGRAIRTRNLPHGRWRVCGLVRSAVGSAGPATKTFAVRR
jgi:hypothetical protein